MMLVLGLGLLGFAILAGLALDKYFHEPCDVCVVVAKTPGLHCGRHGHPDWRRR